MHLSCEAEADIAAITKRLADAGITSTGDSTTVRCTDPIFGHSIVIDVGSPHSSHQRKLVHSTARASVHVSIRVLMRCYTQSRPLCAVLAT